MIRFQINLLNVPEHVLKTNKQELNTKDQEIVDVVCASCTALWAVSQSFKSKIEIYKLNAVKYFGKLLQSCHEPIIIATLGAITQCATQVCVIILFTLKIIIDWVYL